MMKKILRTRPSFKFEQQLWEKGISHVIGIDEVGRGAFAGPIVAAGVIYPPHFSSPFLKKINDSKLLTPKMREELSEFIKQNSLFYAIEKVEVEFINQQGIGKANAQVFRKVIKSIMYQVESSMYKNFKNTKYIIPNTRYFILIDGFHTKYLPGGLKKQNALVKGDRKSISIASASILAKVYRDNLMRKLGRQFTSYFFEQNMGYGTKLHQKAISKHGLSPIHRTSFNLKPFLGA